MSRAAGVLACATGMDGHDWGRAGLGYESENLVFSLSLVAKSCPTLETPWTVACQAPLSMGFSRQEYWIC